MNTATAELDHLGDEIVEFSAHLAAATAHLLDRIGDFDPRMGRSNYPASGTCSL